MSEDEKEALEWARGLNPKKGSVTLLKNASKDLRDALVEIQRRDQEMESLPNRLRAQWLAARRNGISRMPGL